MELVIAIINALEGEVFNLRKRLVGSLLVRDKRLTRFRNDTDNEASA